MGEGCSSAAQVTGNSQGPAVDQTKPNKQTKTIVVLNYGQTMLKSVQDKIQKHYLHLILQCKWKTQLSIPLE